MRLFLSPNLDKSEVENNMAVFPC